MTLIVHFLDCLRRTACSNAGCDPWRWAGGRHSPCRRPTLGSSSSPGQCRRWAGPGKQPPAPSNTDTQTCWGKNRNIFCWLKKKKNWFRKSIVHEHIYLSLNGGTLVNIGDVFGRLQAHLVDVGQQSHLVNTWRTEKRQRIGEALLLKEFNQSVWMSTSYFHPCHWCARGAAAYWSRGWWGRTPSPQRSEQTPRSGFGRTAWGFL